MQTTLRPTAPVTARPAKSVRRVAVALGLGATVLLTGCSGTADSAPSSAAPTSSQASSAAPASTAPTSAATSAAPSASASNSSGPADASAAGTPLRELISEPQAPEATNDDAGALAFASYYVESMDWAYATGDASVLRTLCTAENEQCARVVSTADMIGESGAIQYGGRSTLAVADGMIITTPTPDTRIVQTRLLIEPLEVRSPSGELLDSRDGYDMTIAFKMRWSGDQWQMYEAVRVD